MNKSTQLNFFIEIEELPKMLDFLRERNCIIIKNNSSSVEAAFDFDFVENNKKSFQIFITNEKFKKDLNFLYLKEKQYYYIDIGSSYVIEFDIGGFYPYSDKELHRSRFYVIFKYYEGDNLIEKSKEFIEWTKFLMKEFRVKFLLKAVNYSDNLISESCLKWIEANNAVLTKAGDKFII